MAFTTLGLTLSNFATLKFLVMKGNSDATLDMNIFHAGPLFIPWPSSHISYSAWAFALLVFTRKVVRRPERVGQANVIRAHVFCI